MQKKFYSNDPVKKAMQERTKFLNDANSDLRQVVVSNSMLMNGADAGSYNISLMQYLNQVNLGTFLYNRIGSYINCKKMEFVISGVYTGSNYQYARPVEGLSGSYNLYAASSFNEIRVILYYDTQPNPDGSLPLVSDLIQSVDAEGSINPLDDQSNPLTPGISAFQNVSNSTRFKILRDYYTALADPTPSLPINDDQPSVTSGSGSMSSEAPDFKNNKSFGKYALKKKKPPGYGNMFKVKLVVKDIERELLRKNVQNTRTAFQFVPIDQGNVSNPLNPPQLIISTGAIGLLIYALKPGRH
jgi:hypothetical protein